MTQAITHIERARGFLEAAQLSANWVREVGKQALMNVTEFAGYAIAILDVVPSPAHFRQKFSWVDNPERGGSIVRSTDELQALVNMHHLLQISCLPTIDDDNQILAQIQDAFRVWIFINSTGSIGLLRRDSQHSPCLLSSYHIL